MIWAALRVRLVSILTGVALFNSILLLRCYLHSDDSAGFLTNIAWSHPSKLSSNTALSSAFEDPKDVALPTASDLPTSTAQPTSSALPSPPDASQPPDASLEAEFLAALGQQSSAITVPTSHKYAFVSFLGPDRLPEHQGDFHVDDDDPYFVGARILTYQLLHAADTKSDIPFIVIVTDDVDESKRQRLRLDGAIVLEVARVDAGNVVTDVQGWKDVLVKLRLWQMTQFEKIAFLDADIILLRPIDGLFADPAAAVRATTAYTSDGVWDTSNLPAEYVFAGSAGTAGDHPWPPEYPFPAYLNVGLFIMRPSTTLFEYYMSLTQLADLPFDPKFPEQNLLNYALRGGGPMPWQQIDRKWLTQRTTKADVEGGVHMVHEHFWEPEHEDVRFYLLVKKYEMEQFYAVQNR